VDLPPVSLVSLQPQCEVGPSSGNTGPTKASRHAPFDSKWPLCLRAPCRLRRRFKSPRIAAMLSFQDLYVGLSPYSAPGTCLHANMPPHHCPATLAATMLCCRSTLLVSTCTVASCCQVAQPASSLGTWHVAPWLCHGVQGACACIETYQDTCLQAGSSTLACDMGQHSFFLAMPAAGAPCCKVRSTLFTEPCCLCLQVCFRCWPPLRSQMGCSTLWVASAR
jgi:hypothetical protein